MIDFEAGAEPPGNGFYFLKNEACCSNWLCSGTRSTC